MAKQETRTFRQIVDSIMSMLKLQQSDSVSRERIKGDVNRAYLQEVVPFHQWTWLRNKIAVQHEAAFTTGTVAVTKGSVTITTSEVILDSRAGYLISVDGQNHTYTIKEHTGGSQTMILEVPYTGATNAAIHFRIWTDAIVLPSDCEDIVQIIGTGYQKPIQGYGLQEFRKLQSLSPKAEGRPWAYSLNEYVNPNPYEPAADLPAVTSRSSSGLLKSLVFAESLGGTTTTLSVGDRIQVSGSPSYDYNIEAIISSLSTTVVENDTITYVGLTSRTEALTADTLPTIKTLASEGYQHYRQLLVHPSISNVTKTLSIDYAREIQPLDADTDEPVLPLKERIILFWLGLSYAYSRERNPEEALAYRQMGEQRMARLAGATDESTDKPSINLSQNYLNSKRAVRRSRSFYNEGYLGVGDIGSSTSQPQGTPNTLATFDNDGYLNSYGLVGLDELSYLDGVTSNIQNQIDSLNPPVLSTGERVLVSSAGPTPSIAESSITTIELSSLADTQPFTGFVLNDNTASPTTVQTWDTAEFPFAKITYSIIRGATVEAGIIILVSNGTDSAIAQGNIASIGSTGITFSTSMVGSIMFLSYQSTSTGSAGALRYKVEK